MSFEVREGDCVEAMRAMPACSVDSVVCDPPYGLEFMGKEWDRFAPQGTTARVQRSTGGNLEREPSTPHGRTSVQSTRSNRVFKCRVCGGWSGSFSESRRARQRPCGCDQPDFDYSGTPASTVAFQAFSQAWATEALRVLKPGGHLLAFGGTRTAHRLVCAVEDAGFEIRDTICWLYGSGFPKSLNVGNGFGTALKPAHEPVVVARKPLSGTVAATVLEHGTGALNISGCRIEGDVPTTVQGGQRSSGGLMNATGGDRGTEFTPNGAGRWPANVCLDEQAAGLLDEQTGELHAPVSNGSAGARQATWAKEQDQHPTYGDSGGASRFFYCAKSSRGERNAGLEGFEEQTDYRTTGAGLQTARKCPEHEASLPSGANTYSCGCAVVYTGETLERRPSANGHPTVKPISLMRWLVRLVTPPGGTICDPFCGSGSTGCAAVLEGFDFVGLEREPEYVQIARARIAWWYKHRGDGQAAEILAAGEVRDAVEATGQLGMFDVDVPERDRAGREGEASAERTYTDRGGSNFAMKPGRRR